MCCVQPGLQERLGPLHDAYLMGCSSGGDGSSSIGPARLGLTSTFYLASLMSDVACGVLVGCLQGAAVQPGSSWIINAAFFCVKAAFALYMTVLRPQVVATK